MISGTTRWCQGFSEPEAGSDLASVRTKAELVDGEWVIQGRKIWTSDAAVADWILLLCRTRRRRGTRASRCSWCPHRSRHRGVGDPHRVGSEEFAEVTFDGVRAPADAVVGEPGQGWAIAMSLLAVERGPADIGWISRFRRTATRLLADPVAGSPHRRGAGHRVARGAGGHRGRHPHRPHARHPRHVRPARSTSCS